MPLVRVLIVFFSSSRFWMCVCVCVRALSFLFPFFFFTFGWWPRFSQDMNREGWGGVCVTCEAGKGFFSPDLDRGPGRGQGRSSRRSFALITVAFLIQFKQ